MDKRTKGRGYTSPIIHRVFSSYSRYSWVEGASLVRFRFIAKSLTKSFSKRVSGSVS
uniref:Uncharacterized protein n=1 Tax=Utricularia reniformis TaxID=192314 RepID=A0A1Y0B4W8_9LAMI|nr:hypothetical protein AEK19_MT0347 [Utricularia reniformis]YP_009382734.1 hypothetical protein AEK19_MT2301 [Utricularia reniformis]ART30619.1 hypothetical protein AEK19_MT0347 [Utricularia reniformis]ART32444.1 hypothetical protein AEK19_MT2301 [Utricularia reniformis]